MSALRANAKARGTSPDRNPPRQSLPHAGRLHKHADYQRVYRTGKRRSLPLMAYFFATQAIADPPVDSQPVGVVHSPKSRPPAPAGPRIGITSGRVLGNAVERNRIKRRMREAIRRHAAELTASVDVIFHPRRAVLDAEFSAIEQDVARALHWIEKAGVA